MLTRKHHALKDIIVVDSGDDDDEVVDQLANMEPACGCDQQRASLLLFLCALPDVLGRVVAVAFVWLGSLVGRPGSG